MTEDAYYSTKSSSCRSAQHRQNTTVRTRRSFHFLRFMRLAKYVVSLLLTSTIVLSQVSAQRPSKIIDLDSPRPIDTILDPAQQRDLGTRQPNKSDYSVFFTIPLGSGGVNYETPKDVESETWGPASLRIAPDGTFLITDTVTNKVLRYNSQGAQTDSVVVGSAGAITDAIESPAGIVALDEAGVEPSVYRLGNDGSIQERIQLPYEIRHQGLSGLAINDQGEVVAEMHGGSSVADLSGNGEKGKALLGERYSTEAPDLESRSSDLTTGVIVKGKTQITVQAKNILGALTVIGTGASGDFFVLIEEISDTGTLYVDQTVRHYSSTGKLLGSARVPVAERYTYVRNGVAVAPDGNVYALVTRSDRADVIRLQFQSALAPILPASNDREVTAGKSDLLMSRSSNSASGLALTATCRTRDDMVNTAWSYINNQTYLSSGNLSGTCAGRGKPHYLGTIAGWYSAVPYDWGGWDTVSDFNSYMSSGYQAGDIDTNAVESCSKGVDCSGFVSRNWGTSSKYSTATLPGISTSIGSVSQLQKGDIMLRHDSVVQHVVMFESLASNGVNTLEATTYNNYDRTVYLYNGWSRFSGYTFYKYNNVCESGQARPVVSSSLRLSSSSPYYVGQTPNGYFGIANRGTASITFAQLLIGGRLNNDQSCSGGCPDFSVIKNLTLAPGQVYSYSATRFLDRSGSYGFFVAYQKADGSWVTSVPTENGATNSLTINVYGVAPKITAQSPSYIYASAYDQTIYFSGTALAYTDYVAVQFPNGGLGYIYPPTQIFTRTYNQLGTKIKFGGRGQYYVWAHTTDGGWSNSWGVYAH